MNSSEEIEMLELCEPETDDLKGHAETQGKSQKPSADLPEPRKESSTTRDKEIDALYVSMGIDLKDPETATSMRMDTTHLHGVDEMSTKDVYSFFEPLKPMTLEWINDSSCNVVWPDEDTAAQVFLRLTRPEELPAESMQTDTAQEATENSGEKEEPTDSNKIVVVEDDEEEGSEDGEIADQKKEEEDKKVPKKVCWRISIKDNKGKGLRMRFATWEDRKVRGAEKYSKYYKKFGNPNFGGLKGLISNSRKRRFKEGNGDEDFSSDKPVFVEDARNKLTNNTSEKLERRESQPRKPKMKMYADEEEDRQKSNKISERLGSITVNLSVEKEEDEEVEDYDELEVSSPQEFGSKSVWDRLQVEVPNSRYPSPSEKKRSRPSSDHSSSRRDLRKKLQQIRHNKKDERQHHVSPLLIAASTK